MVFPALETLQIGIGQDVGSIQNYVRSFAGDGGVPYAVMSYTALTSLEGLWSPTEYGSGIQYASGALNEISGSKALQLGLYIDDLEGAANGSREGNITRLRTYLNSLSPDVALVRIGYEFDNPGNNYDPMLYRKAFENIAKNLKTADNVKTVWHSWCFPETLDGLEFTHWWPGNEFVDYVGVSIFQQAYGDSPLGDLRRANEVAFFAKNKSKPLIICESTPFGLGHTEAPDTIWARWFSPVIDYIKQHKVQLWSYINCNWDIEPMWLNQSWGDTRIEQYPHLRSLWTTQVLSAFASPRSQEIAFLSSPSTFDDDNDIVDTNKETLTTDAKATNDRIDDSNDDDTQATGTFSSAHSGKSPFAPSNTMNPPPTSSHKHQDGLTLRKAYPKTAAAAHSSSYSFAAITIPSVVIILFALGAVICPPAPPRTQRVGSAATIFYSQDSPTSSNYGTDDNLPFSQADSKPMKITRFYGVDEDDDNDEGSRPTSPLRF